MSSQVDGAKTHARKRKATRPSTESDVVLKKVSKVSKYTKGKMISLFLSKHAVHELVMMYYGITKFSSELLKMYGRTLYQKYFPGYFDWKRLKTYNHIEFVDVIGWDLTLYTKFPVLMRSFNRPFDIESRGVLLETKRFVLAQNDGYPCVEMKEPQQIMYIKVVTTLGKNWIGILREMKRMIQNTPSYEECDKFNFVLLCNSYNGTDNVPLRNIKKIFRQSDISIVFMTDQMIHSKCPGLIGDLKLKF